MARSRMQLQPVSEVWDWQLMGLCRERPGAQFFHPDDDLGRISRRLREAAAKRVCDTCPVRRQCATHALAVGEEYGVWGGFSENDRSLLRDLGWQDTLDRRRLADVPTLERRLERARAKAQAAKLSQSGHSQSGHNQSGHSSQPAHTGRMPVAVSG